MKAYRQTTRGIDGPQLCDEPDPPHPAGRQVPTRAAFEYFEHGSRVGKVVLRHA